MRIPPSLAALAAMLIASAAHADAPAASRSPLETLPIERRTLSNGLRVVMSPNPGVPTVAISVAYDVGSRNEPEGRTGFAHLFEHMMFEGSANVGPREHSALIESRGGEDNGTTSEDRTLYFETLPSNELALGLWLEADRMKSLAVTEENFENQRQTVMEERRMRYDNQPYIGSFLRLHELAYAGYFPYAHSVIGDMTDLENAPLSAVQEFFQTYYAPNNAVLSIAGDFDAGEAMELVERYFGAIPSHDVPAFDPGSLPEASGPRRETLSDRLANLPAFHVAYAIPPYRTPDHYALEMLVVALGDGESSRLYQELVKQREICTEISAYTEDMRGPDTLGVFGIVAEGHTNVEARDAVLAILADVAEHGLPERELQKARTRLRSSFVFMLESNLSRSNQLAEFEIIAGDATGLRTELDRYLAVTNADIRRVASQYLTENARTELLVDPGAPGSDAAAQPATEGAAR